MSFPWKRESRTEILDSCSAGMTFYANGLLTQDTSLILVLISLRQYKPLLKVDQALINIFHCWKGSNIYTTTLWSVDWNIHILWELVNGNFRKGMLKKCYLLHQKILLWSDSGIQRLPTSPQIIQGSTINRYEVKASCSWNNQISEGSPVLYPLSRFSSGQPIHEKR